MFPGNLSRKIDFHNFHPAIFTPLIHTRLTIPNMFVFMQSKMDYIKWETHKKISFSLKIIVENNFPQFSSCYSYFSRSYASNDTKHGCIYLEYWTIFDEKHPGKLSSKIVFHNFHLTILTPLGHTRSTIPNTVVFIWFLIELTRTWHSDP